MTFPQDATRERALTHSAYARSLWNLGRYQEAAQQYEAGAKATSNQANKYDVIL